MSKWIRYLDCLTNVYAATNEFEISRQRIKENELTNYFKEKEGLKPYLTNFDDNQTSLNRFS